MTLLRKCLIELRAHYQDHQMNELNGHDIEDLRPGMHATFSKTITGRFFEDDSTAIRQLLSSVKRTPTPSGAKRR